MAPVRCYGDQRGRRKSVKRNISETESSTDACESKPEAKIKREEAPSGKDRNTVFKSALAPILKEGPLRTTVDLKTMKNYIDIMEFNIPEDARSMRLEVFRSNATAMGIETVQVDQFLNDLYIHVMQLALNVDQVTIGAALNLMRNSLEQPMTVQISPDFPHQVPPMNQFEVYQRKSKRNEPTPTDEQIRKNFESLNNEERMENMILWGDELFTYVQSLTGFLENSKNLSAEYRNYVQKMIEKANLGHAKIIKTAENLAITIKQEESIDEEAFHAFFKIAGNQFGTGPAETRQRLARNTFMRAEPAMRIAIAELAKKAH